MTLQEVKDYYTEVNNDKLIFSNLIWYFDFHHLNGGYTNNINLKIDTNMIDTQAVLAKISGLKTVSKFDLDWEVSHGDDAREIK